MLSGKIDKGVWNGFYLALMALWWSRSVAISWAGVRTKKEDRYQPPQAKEKIISISLTPALVEQL